MDVAILLRVVPALLAAVAVGWWAVRDREIAVGTVVDQVLRAVLVGVVAARLGWIVLGGPLVWRRVLSTVFLLRAGVETVLGASVALAWVAGRSDPEERAWLLVAAPPATLAGFAAWHASCGVEGVCAGLPVGWGVALPGYASRVAPVGYLEAAAAAVLAVLALRWRQRPALAVGTVAVYALVRAGLGFLRAPLVSLPTRDQLLSLVAAAALGAIAVRLRRHSAPSTDVPS